MIELKTFSAQISRTTLVSSLEKVSCRASKAASTFTSCPVLSQKAPGMCVVSLLNNIIEALAPIFRGTSTTPVNLDPGFLFSGINLKASNDSKDNE